MPVFFLEKLQNQPPFKHIPIFFWEPLKTCSKKQRFFFFAISKLFCLRPSHCRSQAFSDKDLTKFLKTCASCSRKTNAPWNKTPLKFLAFQDRCWLKFLGILLQKNQKWQYSLVKRTFSQPGVQVKTCLIALTNAKQISKL